ncbi:MAG TPA: PfkB family carbohydrate kinase [Kofleriaceae bacterium]|nr:PfkB family carbohydrate kinase [Kofleriaceae bacterium]
MTAVLVWGELLWDRFPDGDRLGGAPANVAFHLAQLGTPVALITRVGDDELGHAAIAQMAAIGVDTSLVQIDAERRTGEVNVTVEHGEPRYRLQPGCSWERIDFTPEVAVRLAGARALVYGTLSQRTPEGLATFGAALAAASPRVARVCDPNLRPSSPAPGDDAALAQALAAADVVKINEREVEMIRARLGHASPTEWLLARGARLVAVTHGAAGSTWYAPPSMQYGPLDVAAVGAAPGGDNVGCGDAYVAGMVHGLLLGWPWPRIGRLAAAVAARVAAVRGATPILDGRALVEDA